MKIRINIATLMSFTLLLFLTTGCSKFLDVNEDPNRVTDNNITPELLFTQGATATGARQASGDFRPIENWLGHWSASNTFALLQDETTYNITTTFSNIWANHYNVLFDLYQANKKAVANNDPVLASAADILSVKLWQDLVDVYGNVPYSQAFQNDQYNQPAYDKGADIYDSLQIKLDNAITAMKSVSTAPSKFVTADVVNKGDLGKWIKFANTLKLRLFIHKSQISGFNPTSEIATLIANGGFLQSGESINVNPGYVDDLNKQSPFYANYGYVPTGGPSSTSTAPNAYFVNILKSSSDTNRLKRFFSLPGRTNTAENPTGAAALTIVGTSYGNSNAAGQPTTESVFGPGLAGTATQPQWILTSVESMFLQAEAIARGWMPGTAVTAYQNAVRESFLWLHADVSTLNAYFNSAIANWANAGTTVQSQVKFILFQKYIALAGIDAMEVWSDYRRVNFFPNTGYLSNNPGRVSNTIPIRLLYPQTEYGSNAANVNAQGTIDQFTSKIFWQP